MQKFTAPKTRVLRKLTRHLRQIINGAPLSSVNPATLTNPECLMFYRDVGEFLRRERP